MTGAITLPVVPTSLKLDAAVLELLTARPINGCSSLETAYALIRPPARVRPPDMRSTFRWACSHLADMRRRGLVVSERSRTTWGGRLSYDTRWWAT